MNNMSNRKRSKTLNVCPNILKPLSCALASDSSGNNNKIELNLPDQGVCISQRIFNVPFQNEIW